jgi:hypothetical protein
VLVDRETLNTYTASMTADNATFRGTALTNRQTEAIADRIQLVPIESLRVYEEPDRHRVVEIEQSLRESRCLLNPIIVDDERNILVDGHHRVAAFAALNLKVIPAFTVDYLSEDVTVRGWYRTTDADATRVMDLFPLDAAHTKGPWSVVSDGIDRRINSCRFDTPLEGARFLDSMTRDLRRGGGRVVLGTQSDAVRSGDIYCFLDPVIGKPEVIAAVEEGRRFPYEVNRHLIGDRPLEVRIPLEVVNSPNGFRRHVAWICQETTPISIKPRFRHHGRIYEERVTLFNPNP